MNRINYLFKLRFLSVCLNFHQLDQQKDGKLDSNKHTIKVRTPQSPSSPTEVRHTPHTSVDGSRSAPYSASSADRSALPYPLCPCNSPTPLHITQHLHRVIEASRRLHLRIPRFAMNRAFPGRIVHHQHAIHIRMEVRTPRQRPHAPDLPSNHRITAVRGRTGRLRRRGAAPTRDRGVGSCVRRSAGWKGFGSTRLRSNSRREGG